MIDSRTFTVVRSRLHPDRAHDPEQKARYRIAFEVFGEIERQVVDKESASMSTLADWDARRKTPYKGKVRPAGKPRPAGVAKTPQGLPKPR
jgi:hypothetical protein